MRQAKRSAAPKVTSIAVGIRLAFYKRLRALGYPQCPRCRDFTGELGLHRCDFLTAPSVVPVAAPATASHEAA